MTTCAGNDYRGTSTTTDGTWGLSTNVTNIIQVYYVAEPRRSFFDPLPAFNAKDWRSLWRHIGRAPIVPVEYGPPSRHGAPPIPRDLTHQALKSRPQMARAPPGA